MNARQHAAVELLLAYPDTIAARMLGVRLSTLRRWMNRPDFKDLMREREAEQCCGAARISRQAVVNAASTLCALASEPGKPEPKLLLEVLKAAGTLEPQVADPGQALAEAIRRAREPADER